MSEAGSPVSISLSLISHTNAGKTTLARTLLGQDVGEVRDAAHVTEVATPYVMLAAADGSQLMLWDTPGFGDTARLVRRLRLVGNPIGWLLSQVWDRYANRPLWSSQQALRNARDHADIILYLVNASEDPADAGYVDLEMEILTWVGKPVVLLLNQMGPPTESAAQEEEKWRQHMRQYQIVRDVLSFDAFARCWVQESVLLRRVAAVLKPEKQAALDRLLGVWQEKNLARFHQSMQVLAQQLAAAACDSVSLDRKSWQDKVRGLLGSGATPPEEQAMALLAERLDAAIRASTDQLIRIHGLEGQAAAEVLRRLREDYSSSQPAPEGMAATMGGLVSGALGGLKADVASGGFTLGGGMLAGAILGAIAAGGAARGYNLVKGERAPSVRWSEVFFEGLVQSGLLRYLAVAHFGRGRGNYSQSEHPKFWQAAVNQAVAARAEEIREIWKRGKQGEPAALVPPLQALLRRVAAELLAGFYPEAALVLARERDADD